MTANSLILQAIIHFMLAKSHGKTREQAVVDFINTPLCQSFGDRLTVANVYGFAEVAGYEA